MNNILDFRNGNKVQVLINKKWYNLLFFKDGEYGVKFSNIKKPFNPYHIFDAKNTELINNYFKN